MLRNLHLKPPALSQKKPIYLELRKVIRTYQPNYVAVETLFFGANSKTVMSVGKVIGVITLAAGSFSIPLVEYPPLKIKMLLTGFGRAKKDTIKKEVKKTLKLKNIPKPSHAADALATAICCIKDDNVVDF